jgi:hypothetical protein
MTTKATLSVEGQNYTYFSLPAAEKQGLGTIDRLPFSIRVLLENMLRVAESPEGALLLGEDAETILRALASWQPQPPLQEIPLMPTRVILQDFTGVPCVVDLAAMRDAMRALGGDPKKINPLVPGRPGHRPLGAGRPLRHRAAPSLAERRAGVRAQPRALRVPALGPAGVSTTSASCRPAPASSTR